MIYICMYVCMHACMYVCMHVCMHAWMYVCMNVCMHGTMRSIMSENVGKKWKVAEIENLPKLKGGGWNWNNFKKCLGVPPPKISTDREGVWKNRTAKPGRHFLGRHATARCLSFSTCCITTGGSPRKPPSSSACLSAVGSSLVTSSGSACWFSPAAWNMWGHGQKPPKVTKK